MDTRENVDSARPLRQRLVKRTPALIVVAGSLAIVAVALANGFGPRAAAEPAAASTAGPATPAGTGIVTRLPSTPGASFAWSPDGLLLLITDSASSHVYDRFGELVATLPPSQDWLDAGHLIGADGSVSDARAPGAAATSAAATTGAPASPATAGTRVMANGHGSAAIVTGTASCAGDPLVDWYRNGRLERTQEHANPLGWSADGDLLLLGHVACGGAPSAAAWQGSVEVVDFATGKVEATLPDVRGEMAFAAVGDSVAATSANGMEEMELGGTAIATLPGVRFLGWLDEETIFVELDGRMVLADLDPPTVDTATTYQAWQAEGPNGLHIAADLTGTVLRVVGSDGSSLLDLSTQNLMTEPVSADGASRPTSMQPSWWSPDGGMLVLQARDGSSVALISVDPKKPA